MNIELDTIILGDALEVPKTFPDNSIDTIITDPPYGLEFMGKEWDKFGVTEGRAKRLLGIDNKGTGDKFFDYREGASERGRYSELTIKEKSAFQEFIYRWAKEALRVAKPGATLLCFGGTRTFHRLACAIEDSGWIIKDTLMWLYGSGFPKSLNIGKAVDKINGEVGRLLKFVEWFRTTGLKQKEINEIIEKADIGSHYLRLDQPAIPTKELWAKLRPYIKIEIPEWVDELVERIEAEREIIGKHPHPAGSKGHTFPLNQECYITAPATPEAQLWEGYGTALKPAYEPIIMAMKPLDGTYADNALKWGVAGLNIDGGRIETKGEADIKAGWSGSKTSNPCNSVVKAFGVDKFKEINRNPHPQGRFPANLLLDEVSAEMLDEQSGERKGWASQKHNKFNPYGGNALQKSKTERIGYYEGYNDTGGASRFFYVAKASSSERNAGCEELPIKDPDDRDDISKGSYTEKGIAPQQNFHPTVKPIKLMDYLVKLTKMPNPNQVYLDPFAGSGSTLIAVLNNDRHFIGIEKEPDYVEIAKARIKYWSSRKDKTLDFGEKGEK
jgi:DNA modification methylase